MGKIVFVTGHTNALTNPNNDRRFWPVELPSSRPTSTRVVHLAGRPEFRRFLASRGNVVDDQEAAQAAICGLCEINSLAQLDTDQDAAHRFQQRINGPYWKFLRNLSA